MRMMRLSRLGIAFLVLSGLFIGFGWWVYFNAAGSVPIAIPLVGTALPFLVAAGYWAFSAWTARKGAQQLETALSEDGARDERAQSAARSAELERLRSEFDKAVKALKGSNLARGPGRSADALYRLPWYAIIGPPASGKTTVLRNSGLKFPYLPGTGDRLKGMGGTRNCDWWLTNHAILLDTAGRWSIDETERNEWLVFLDLLKKHRGSRPLNGIIAAISLAGDDATSISGATSEEIRDIALRMRERLDEITGRLGVVVPVYLLFTKCDLIKGFVESFGSMSGEQRKQVWGFTAPLLQSARRDPANYFAQQFDVLLDTLESRAEARIGCEVDQRAIPLIYEFPAQFAALKQKLTLFVDELFDASAYRDTPLLRGAYFTSGAQEGAPADLLFNDIANEIKRRPEPIANRLEKKGYFLHDMLMRVVFEDRALAVASDAELVRRAWLRRGVTVALFTFALLGAALSTHAGRYNLQRIATTEGVHHNKQALVQQGGEVVRGPTQVPELLALEADLRRYEGGDELYWGMGMYQGERIQPALTHYMLNALTESLVRPLMEQNHAQLLMSTQQLVATMGTDYGGELDDGVREELRASLALHLLLTEPRERCTPPPLARKEFIENRLLELWARSVPAESVAVEDRSRLVARYLTLISGDGHGTRLEQDASVIAEARAALGDDDVVERLLARVIDSYGETHSLASLAGPSLALHGDGSLSGAFTREAWMRLNKQVGTKDFLEDEGDWVFGCGEERHDEERAKEDLKKFHERYLARYEHEWQTFVSAASGRKPKSAADALAMLNEFVGRPGALGAWFAQVAVHTSLPLKGTAAADKAARKAVTDASKTMLRGRTRIAAEHLGKAAENVDLTVESLRRAFGDYLALDQATQPGAATALDAYRRQLEPVMVALKAYRDDETRVDDVARAAQSALDNTELLLSAQGGRWTTQLRALLVPVLTGVLDLVRSGRSGQLARGYCDAVYGPFQRDLAGRFPINPASTNPASLVAFRRFFQPDKGSLWAFTKNHLGGYVHSEGGHFRFTGSSARSLLRPELLKFLQRAAAVTEAFFPNGAQEPQMPYRVRVRGAPGYSLTTFRAGSRSVRYDSGEERWVPLTWPAEGDGDKTGVALSVVPYGGQAPRPLAFENPWGLFMIMQPFAGAQPVARSSKHVTFGWRPRTSQNIVKIDFASDDPRSPLLRGPTAGKRSTLFPLQAPPRISPSGAACARSSR